MMELSVSVMRPPPVRASSDCIFYKLSRRQHRDDCRFAMDLNTYRRGIRNNRILRVSSALAETAVSIAVAATVVGVAATLLVKRTKEANVANEVPMMVCDACQGSGICPECKGEGFVLKRLSDQSSEKARLTAQNAATRYTAGLPKKWSYCSKCSSSRTCLACGGQGKISF